MKRIKVEDARLDFKPASETKGLDKNVHVSKVSTLSSQYFINSELFHAGQSNSEFKIPNSRSLPIPVTCSTVAYANKLKSLTRHQNSKSPFSYENINYIPSVIASNCLSLNENKFPESYALYKKDEQKNAQSVYDLNENRYLNRMSKITTSSGKQISLMDWADKFGYQGQDPYCSFSNLNYKSFSSTPIANHNVALNTLADLKDDDVWLQMNSIMNKSGLQSCSSPQINSYDDHYSNFTSDNQNNGVSVYNISQSKQRKRTQFTQEQLNNLEDLFQENHYPNSEEKKRLSFRINIEEAKIHVWFQNRRSRENKMRRFHNKKLKTEGQSYKYSPSTCTNNEALAAIPNNNGCNVIKDIIITSMNYQNSVSSSSFFYALPPLHKPKYVTSNSTLSGASIDQGYLSATPDLSFQNTKDSDESADYMTLAANINSSNKKASSCCEPSLPHLKFNFTLNDATNKLLLNNFAYANYMINGGSNNIDSSQNSRDITKLNCFNSLDAAGYYPIKSSAENLELKKGSVSIDSSFEKGYNQNKSFFASYKLNTRRDGEPGFLSPHLRGPLISTSGLCSTSTKFNELRYNPQSTIATFPEACEDEERLFEFNSLQDDLMLSPLNIPPNEETGVLSYSNNQKRDSGSRLGSLSFLDEIFQSEDYSMYDTDTQSKTETGLQCNAERDFLDEVNPLFAKDSLRGYHSDDFDGEF